MDIKSIIPMSRIRLLACGTKNQAIEELIDSLLAEEELPPREKIVERILYREKLMSTGIGLGVAVPHARMPGIKSLTASIGLCPGGIKDYDSIDDKPIRMVILVLAGEKQHKEYITFLSKIMSRLKENKTTETIFDNPENVYLLFTKGKDD